MRLPPLLAIALVAACGEPQAGDEAAEAVGPGVEDARIECRPEGAERFERVCTAEPVEGERGLTLILRKPDGGFRRLLVTEDGRGVTAADGAEPALVTLLADERIEVVVGGDAFRLPASVRAR